MQNTETKKFSGLKVTGSEYSGQEADDQGVQLEKHERVMRGEGGGRLQGCAGHLRVDRVLALHRGGGELRGGVQVGVLRLPDTFGILKN